MMTVIHVIVDIAVVYTDLRAQLLPNPASNVMSAQNKRPLGMELRIMHGANQSRTQWSFTVRGVCATESDAPSKGQQP